MRNFVDPRLLKIKRNKSFENGQKKIKAFKKGHFESKT